MFSPPFEDVSSLTNNNSQIWRCSCRVSGGQRRSTCGTLWAFFWPAQVWRLCEQLSLHILLRFTEIANVKPLFLQARWSNSEKIHTIAVMCAGEESACWQGSSTHRMYWPPWKKSLQGGPRSLEIKPALLSWLWMPQNDAPWSLIHALSSRRFISQHCTQDVVGNDIWRSIGEKPWAFQDLSFEVVLRPHAPSQLHSTCDMDLNKQFWTGRC